MKKESTTLSKSVLGTIYEIISVNTNKTIQQRIFDLGIIPGAIIKPVQKSPLGDPTAYCIQGSIIALRNSDAANIIVKKY